MIVVALLATACGASRATSPTAPSSHSPAANASATPTATPAPTPLPLSALSNLAPPGPLSGFAVGYDPVTQRLILEGGNPDGTLGIFTAATWAWNGKLWTQLSPATEPSPEAQGSMAVDPASGHLMYMGGDASTAGAFAPNEGTWLWNGSTWARVADNPCQGGYPALAVDPATKQLLANCAGLMGAGAVPPAWYLSGLFLWTGNGWLQAQTVDTGDTEFDVPADMLGLQAAVAYDPVSRRLIEFGGDQQWAFDGTMTYDGTAWATLDPPNLSGQALPNLPPGGPALAATDESAGQIVMLADSVDYPNLATTWTWDGSTWVRELVDEPSVDALNGQMVWDPAINHIVLVDWPGSGSLQVWVWEGTSTGWEEIPS